MQYENYQGMIRQLAKSHSPENGEWREMESVGRMAFLKARDTFDPTKAKFSTHLYTVVSRAMIDYYRSQKRHQGLSFDYILEKSEEVPYYSNMLPMDTRSPDREIEFRSDMGSMSETARDIIKIIFESPQDLIEASKSMAPKYLRGALTRILRSRGFKWNEIERGIKEIKQTLELG